MQEPSADNALMVDIKQLLKGEKAFGFTSPARKGCRECRENDSCWPRRKIRVFFSAEERDIGFYVFLLLPPLLLRLPPPPPHLRKIAGRLVGGGGVKRNIVLRFISFRLTLSV